jgi:hypothetical protein
LKHFERLFSKNTKKAISNCDSNNGDNNSLKVNENNDNNDDQINMKFEQNSDIKIKSDNISPRFYSNDKKNEKNIKNNFSISNITNKEEKINSENLIKPTIFSITDDEKTDKFTLKDFKNKNFKIEKISRKDFFSVSFYWSLILNFCFSLYYLRGNRQMYMY